jgi:UDP-N-acetylmuramate--alanine ligase
MKHKVKHIHFIGIGGSGMSGIAEVLLNQGYVISGSDITQNAVTQKLIQIGAQVYIGHVAEQVHGADVVVVSSAVKENNPEVEEARSRNIPVIPRAMMLAELMRLKQGIAIAGTHGKTTTTSLVASILGQAKLDPTYVIGGKLTAVGHHARLGAGHFIVAEADESDASFLYLNPIMAVVTNIDADHMDTYGHDFEKLKQAFIDFLQHLPFYGRAVLCIEDDTVRSIAASLAKPITTYGFTQEADIYADNIKAHQGQMVFDAVWKNGITHHLPITLNLPGRHNVLNALAAIAIALEAGCDHLSIQTALREFGGVGRRFQRYGELALPGGGSCTLIDDYGHHPAEVAATIEAARGAFPGQKLVIAFQPHRYTRTRDLFEDFVQVLSKGDGLLLAEVYPAGEAPLPAADSRTLARALRVVGKVEPIFVPDIAQMAEQILMTAKSGDVVITMGAGSIGSVAGQLIAGQQDKRDEA